MESVRKTKLIMLVEIFVDWLYSQVIPRWHRDWLSVDKRPACMFTNDLDPKARNEFQSAYQQERAKAHVFSDRYMSPGFKKSKLESYKNDLNSYHPPKCYTSIG